MTALIVAPTLVAVLLAGIRVVGSIESLNGYQQVRQSAEYSVRLRDLIQQLGLERDISTWGPKRKIKLGTGKTITLAQQTVVVDGLAKQVNADLDGIDAGYGVRAEQDAEQAATGLTGLAKLRDKREIDGYTTLIATLLRLHDELAQTSDDPEVVGDARALTALAHAKEEASEQRATLTRELLEHKQQFVGTELTDFIASQSRQQSDTDTFITESQPEQSKQLVTLLSDPDVVEAELAKAWAIQLGTRNTPLSTYNALTRTQTLQRWFQDSTKTIDQMATVEHRVSASVLDRARGLQSSEQRNVLIAGGLILALLLLVLATTVLIARSMVRPLRRLRAEALEIAGLRLPDMVRRMRESDDTSEPHVRPISVGTEDEIGEVAQAFDEVHRQAVRLAAEESRLRSNVNAMFVNLSRRTQTLVERQIALIDGLERGEEDGQRLSDLFKLDHLATRMRRNSENLLVLAGHEPARKRSQPARLVDVVRASLSEIEDYERVTVKVHRSIAIAGHAANDIVHLVAELVENAIAFSPRNTRVIVSSSPVEGGAVMLGVSDAGIGMSPEEVADINHRLAEPPTVDVSVSRRMGLFVVGRLALRHGIRVQMRRGDQGGMIAMVLFPAEMISNADQAAPAQPATATVGAFADQPQMGGGASASGGFQSWNAPPAAPEATGTFSPWTSSAPTPPANGLPTRRSPGHDGGPLAAGGEARSGASSDTGAFAPFGAPPEETTASFPAVSDTAGGLLPGRQRPGRPTFTEHSGAFPIMEPGEATGPLPVVEDAPLERGDEYLPIFAAVESAWFRRPAPNGAGTPAPGPNEQAGHAGNGKAPDSGLSRPAAAGTPGRQTGPVPGPLDPPGATSEQGAWWSRADSGFEKAAGVAKDPTQGGVTAAGLPKRTPKANLVPGSVGGDTPAPAPRPPVSADAVRSRLSSLQQGVRRGRADLAGGSADGLGNEEEGS
ncbi:sensor histidine kinase [Planotetraspora silvatica]|uniref:sensor histidine kinase n=1 Tax=Planotetraspora silvatica TaxID=234614 RepID=UPI00194DC681|nr:nitrate- and nitrite sensing domain-containing protein [Planotetraspora silvatica]